MSIGCWKIKYFTTFVSSNLCYVCYAYYILNGKSTFKYFGLPYY